MQEQPEPAFAPGLTARVELTVTDADTAQAVGSGDVPVLGTPRVLALAEAATVAATATSMPGGSTTVGVHVELEHLAATPVGRRVLASARLVAVDGRRLQFDVTVTDYDFGDRYRFILDVARTIDPLGFRAVWTPERHFHEFGGSFPSPARLANRPLALNRSLRMYSQVEPWNSLVPLLLTALTTIPPTLPYSAETVLVMILNSWTVSGVAFTDALLS